MAGNKIHRNQNKSSQRHSGGRHFGMEDGAQNTKIKVKRSGPYAHSGKRVIFTKPVIAAASVLLVVCAVIFARGLGLFNLTMGAPDLSSSSEPASNAGTVSKEPEPVSTSEPQSSSLPQPTLEPPAGGAAYTQKYPELWVPKSEFSELVEGDKVVYLTFDDGPCKSSPRLLEVLDELEVKATFFFTAQFMDREGMVREIKDAYDRGHAVGVHTYTHVYKDIYSSVEAYLDDYKQMDDIIVEATGVRSSIFRLPGGSNSGYNMSIREDLLAEMTRRGFIYHDWNAYNGDSDGFGYEAQIEKAVTEGSYNDKSVILMHNSPDKDTVIDTLYKIIPKLRDKGYRFDILDETVRPIQIVKVAENPEAEGGQSDLPDGQPNESQKSGDQTEMQNSGSSTGPEDPQS